MREAGEVLLAVLGTYRSRPQLRASFGLRPRRTTVLDLVDQIQNEQFKYKLNERLGQEHPNLALHANLFSGWARC